MTINYPTTLDTNATLPSNLVDGLGGNTVVAAHPNNLAAAIKALEAKVGINSSLVTGSLDYKVNTLLGLGGGTSLSPTGNIILDDAHYIQFGDYGVHLRKLAWANRSLLYRVEDNIGVTTSGTRFWLSPYGNPPTSEPERVQITLWHTDAENSDGTEPTIKQSMAWTAWGGPGFTGYVFQSSAAGTLDAPLPFMFTFDDPEQAALGVFYSYYDAVTGVARTKVGRRAPATWEGSNDVVMGRVQISSWLMGMSTTSGLQLYGDATSTNGLFLTIAGQAQLAATGNTGGVLMGGDTQLYRSAADVVALASGDALRVIGGAADFASPSDGMMWYNSTSNRFRFRANGVWQTFQPVTDPTIIDVVTAGIVMPNNKGFIDNVGANELLLFTGVSSAINQMRVTNSAGGSPPILSVEGGDPNVDMFLQTQGTGVLRFGTHSALGAETVTGYITIKDAGGTTRKVAIVS
jgi:hypothetical protein